MQVLGNGVMQKPRSCGSLERNHIPQGLEIALVRVQEQGDTYLMCVNAGALRQPWFPWGAAEVGMLGARSQKDPGSFCTIRFGGPGGAGGCEREGEDGILSIMREPGRRRSGDLLG